MILRENVGKNFGEIFQIGNYVEKWNIKNSWENYLNFLLLYIEIHVAGIGRVNKMNVERDDLNSTLTRTRNLIKNVRRS